MYKIASKTAWTITQRFNPTGMMSAVVLAFLDLDFVPLIHLFFRHTKGQRKLSQTFGLHHTIVIVATAGRISQRMAVVI